MPLEISEVNRSRWASKRARRAYRDNEGLFPVETAIFESLKSKLGDWRVLDIGVGSGRTTIALAHRFKEYIGVDYSEQMLLRAKERSPSAHLILADARRMPLFADSQFDMAIFSFNGIDYVEHSDRLMILEEIRRILCPKGVFFFSSHNRDYSNLAAVATPILAPTWNPVRLARRLTRFRNHRRNSKRLEELVVEKQTYAIVNDVELDHSLLTYYTSHQSQRAQLARVGFSGITAYDIQGRTIAAEKTFSSDYMIHYLASRA
jgi:ubiquinone/menaquinone biosynthesis C-methylase UbiE